VCGAFGALKLGNYISIIDKIQNNQDRTILKKYDMVSQNQCPKCTLSK
jgi:hypothetical protein